MSDGVLENDKGISARGMVPWHRSPQWKVYEEQGIKVSQVIEDCFDWTVRLEQAERLNGAGEKVIVPDLFYVVREDIDHVLGHVGKRYAPLQNVDACQVFTNIVDDGEILIDTAGSLWNGKKIFISAQFPAANMTVGGDDREGLETYLLLTNSHDGTGALEIAVVVVRTVCQNTLSWALSSALRSYKVRHTSTILDRAMQSRAALEMAFKATETLAAEMAELTEFSLSDKDFEKLLDLTLPLPTDEGRGLTRRENQRASVEAIYRGTNYGQEHILGTGYGALMAFSAYSDHEAGSRGTETSTVEENQFRVLVNGNQPLVNTAAPIIKSVASGKTTFNKLIKEFTDSGKVAVAA